ncbi:hypothetical protein IBL26_18630 [Roseomonas aerophila]|uniref:Uncharacterized protein n=1 Tax=Teichococcus aerophilus TaxID=1224513 RepID=A0ABR7RRU0_9PROT|nr:hypothetical protein [Pseudoroseomonas aerophila]MBC9208870.1 hypothetical protein [Pseudoroseomonas aerophila]
MAPDPLKAALPRLRIEAATALRLARLDVILAVGLTLAAMFVAVVVIMAPLHGGMLLVLAQIYVALAAGVAAAIWAAIVLERSAPRMKAARRIIQSLQSGAMLEALELALRALPISHADA